MKKLFWMTRSQRFSIRKYSIGVASVLIGMFLLGTPKGASADELTNTNDVTTTEAEPKMSSPELAYYDAGDGVNYDKVLLSDGHYWISYVSFSGNRRYISVAVA